MGWFKNVINDIMSKTASKEDIKNKALQELKSGVPPFQVSSNFIREMGQVDPSFSTGPWISSLYAAMGRVHAVVTKPRTFYVAGVSSFGGPAFALDGKPIGIQVMRSLKSGGARSMFSDPSDLMAGIVLPSSTVLKIAEQAKATVPQE